MHPHFSLTRSSLALRISLVVSILLIVAGAVTGFTIFKRVQHSLNDDLESQINARMAWLEASVELDGGQLEFEPNQARIESTVKWKISFRNGDVLWSENWAESEHKSKTQTRIILVGDPKGNMVPTNSLIKLDKQGPFGYGYKLPDEHGRIELVLTTRASYAHIGDELHRLNLALWMIGPLFIFVLCTILAFFIRWQLRPLHDISLRASQIGPQNVESRIDSVGNSLECVLLKDSINTMIDRLAQGLSRERQFAYSAAHELRTPVAQLRTGIEVALRKQRPEEEYRVALTQALADVLRMQNLIEHLLMLTRTQQPLEALESVSLKQIVTQAAQRASIDVDYPVELGENQVKGNEELLLCGFRNVLENAVRYAPGPQPEIRVATSGAEVELAVSDHGPGIAESDRERIFEPLTRLDQARSIGEAADGFGLGLAVARSAVRACGGELFCRARLDGKHGAEFVFRLKDSGAI